MLSLMQFAANNFQENKIADSAYKYQQAIEKKSQIIVGTNKFTDNKITNEKILKIDSAATKKQLNRLKKFKKQRDINKVHHKCHHMQITDTIIFLV